jgi:hypothetical protein
MNSKRDWWRIFENFSIFCLLTLTLLILYVVFIAVKTNDGPYTTDEIWFVSGSLILAFCGAMAGIISVKIQRMNKKEYVYPDFYLGEDVEKE